MDQFRYGTVQSTMVADGVRMITLNRPERLNAMNRVLVEDVAQAFDDANQEVGTRCIVFTGRGRAFCAGDDRQEHVQPPNEMRAKEIVDAVQRVTRSLVFGKKPVVGAINGWAVGGGVEWAINCDFPICGESARAYFPEVALNTFVTGAVSSFLPALVGLNKAREMLFFGEKYGAEKLLELGVAWRVVADERLLEEARNVAMRLSALPPTAVSVMKQVLNKCASVDLENALQLETRATVKSFLDPETTKRMKDF